MRTLPQRSPKIWGPIKMCSAQLHIIFSHKGFIKPIKVCTKWPQACDVPAAEACAEESQQARVQVTTPV